MEQERGEFNLDCWQEAFNQRRKSECNPATPGPVDPEKSPEKPAGAVEGGRMREGAACRRALTRVPCPEEDQGRPFSNGPAAAAPAPRPALPGGGPSAGRDVWR
eukprot:1597288-Pyramimonas_sp.AAC.1